MSGPTTPKPTGPSRLSRTLSLVALIALPAVAVTELVAGEVQHRRVPPESDWNAAASAATAMKRPGDGLVVAPRWAEGHGRKALGFGVPPAAGSVDRFFDVRLAGRADLETFPRVLELSIRGKDDPQLARFRMTEERRFGLVSLRVFENPAPQKLLRDLADEIDPTAQVFRVGPGGDKTACRWEESGSQHMPNLAAGPDPAPNRFMCPPNDPVWTWVGPTVITDLSYTPRRCVLMHPHESSTLTVELPARPIGRGLVAYVGLHVYAERDLKGAPVFARVSIAGKEVAQVRHRDGDGWVRFEGSTEPWAGTSQPVRLETWAEGGNTAFRSMCVAAQLRE